MRTYGFHGVFISVGFGIGLLLCTGISNAAGQSADRPERPSLTVQGDDNAGYVLSLENQAPFHRTPYTVTDSRLVEVPASTTLLATWNETQEGKVVPFYAISLDGPHVATVRETSYELKLRHGDFDPEVGVRPVAELLSGNADSTLYIVQFITQPLEQFRSSIRELGGSVHHFLAHHAHIVAMSAEVRDQVAALPFVRWVGVYHPAYRLEEGLEAELLRADAPDVKQRYNIQVVRKGPEQKILVAERIGALGGDIEALFPEGYLLEASLTPRQLREIVRMNEVFFVDRWLPPQTYMNNVRIDGGANQIENAGGYTGTGVRAEVMDSGLMVSHQAFQGHPPIVHTCNSSDTSHGTSVYGINFGNGTGNPSGRGVVPDAQGIIASYNCVGNRYSHTLQLVQSPYFAVYQTNSWGSCCTLAYGTQSMQMDDMIFDSDLVILQAQANTGNRNSDVSAWAKNVVSVGGIRHFNTSSRSDDAWSAAGSIGPAADGRVKPDLSYWYDSILTTSNSGGYTTGFGGTSAATPMTAGHFGLFFQMWSEGIFGNEVDLGGTVFANRPHSSTARAVMINTAERYSFSGTGHDLSRVHQGWGTANVGNLYDLRDKISVIDETIVLAELETATFQASVGVGEPALRATLVYTDPPGTTSSSLHRINDLTLRVTSPSQVVYWGNNGLLAGNWSTPGGSPNTIDVVENVFVQNPEAGGWTVEVIASDINQDNHLETPALDADFALVVTGGVFVFCSSQGALALDASRYGCDGMVMLDLVDCDLNTDQQAMDSVIVSITSETEPAGESVLLTETGLSTARFQGAILLNAVDAVGTLQVTHEDTITATYVDANDGEGDINVVVTTAADVDCSPPTVSDVQAISIGLQNATITFDSDEPAQGTVRYGTDCGTLPHSVGESLFSKGHGVNLVGLSDSTTYFYVIDAVDDLGNAGTADNGGACFTFSTIVPPPTPQVGDDTCWINPATDTGIPCASNADCQATQVCGSKSRYLTFKPSGAAVAGVATTIQVEILSMPQFPARVGEKWWAAASESISNPPGADLKGSQLKCTDSPHAEEWPVGDFHLYGEAVVPGSTYQVRMCDSTAAICSVPLLVVTGKWGDAIRPFGGGSQPNFADINSIIQKFQNLALAPVMPRVDLVGAGNPGQPNVPNRVANFADISNDVSAFSGFPYPFTVAACP